MKLVKKYIPCTKRYWFMIYAFGMGFFALLTWIESCPGRPFAPQFAKGIFFFAILFTLIKPFLGLIFTQKSMNACKFHLPYRYIKKIEVDEIGRKLTITYNYNTVLCRKSEKEYRYDINTDNYKTTIPELIQCFPEDIKIVYV